MSTREPPLHALLARLPGGRIAYRIKKLRGRRAKVRVMTPLEFLARLAALVAPPRYPLLRYHGVLGPRSSWRRDVVPKPPAERGCPVATRASPPSATPSTIARKPSAPPDAPANSRHEATLDTPTPPTPPPPVAASHARTTVADAPPTSPTTEARLLAANIIGVRHWSRILHGALYAAAPRIDWARLLRRTFDVDVLRCAACGGRLRVVREVNDPAAARLVLESLALPSDPPRAARARDPTELLGDAEIE
jgi:Putative transposase